MLLALFIVGAVTSRFKRSAISVRCNPGATPAYSVSLVVRCYNRPEYLERLLLSLLCSDCCGCERRILYDDGSDLPEMAGVFARFEREALFEVITAANQGGYYSLRPALRGAESSELVCYLDDDVVVAKGFVGALQRTYMEIERDTGHSRRSLLLTGFNCVPPACAHPYSSPPERTYVEKETIGGVSMFFSSEMLEYLVDEWEAGSDWGVCRSLKSCGGGIYATVPSVIQHIGKQGLNSDGTHWDTAADFCEECT